MFSSPSAPRECTTTRWSRSAGHPARADQREAAAAASRSLTDPSVGPGRCRPGLRAGIDSGCDVGLASNRRAAGDRRRPITQGACAATSIAAGMVEEAWSARRIGPRADVVPAFRAAMCTSSCSWPASFTSMIQDAERAPPLTQNATGRYRSGRSMLPAAPGAVECHGDAATPRSAASAHASGRRRRVLV